MHWIFIALMTAFFYGLYNVFIKIASGHIHEIVGAVILQVVAALLGGVILIVLRFMDHPLDISSKGVLFAVLAGIFVGLAEITSFYLFSKGVAASVGVPVIIGGSVVIAAAVGLLFLKETLLPLHYLAVVMIVAGVALLTSK